jgi:hypothetical protein
VKTITKRNSVLTYKATFNRNLLGVYDRKGQVLSTMLSVIDVRLGKSVVNDFSKTVNPTDMNLNLSFPDKGLRHDVKLTSLEAEASNTSEQGLESFFEIGQRLLESVKAVDSGAAVINQEFTYDVHGDMDGGTVDDLLDALMPGSKQLKGYNTNSKTAGFVFGIPDKESLRIYLERSFTVEKGIFLRTNFVALGDLELTSAVDAWRRSSASIYKELGFEVK